VRPFIIASAAVSAVVLSTPAAAQYACGARPCSTTAKVKGSSVIPDPNEFDLRGDLFSERFQELVIAPNSGTALALGFNVNFGTGITSTLFVNENGAVSFGAPIPPASTGAAPGFLPVASLTDLPVDVIAPFYADLVQNGRGANGDLGFGDIVVQYGQADPYADEAGVYSLRELRQAVRITWYGLGVPGSTAPGTVLAQLLITGGDDGSLSTFEFRYGPAAAPGQDGLGSIAGFSVGDNALQFTGPYRDGVPTFFEFLDGRYIGQGGAAAVPEPATWASMIAGFALIGGMIRARRRRPAFAIA